MSCRHDNGGTTECVSCEFEPFVKNNYFTGKMMGASDFIAETHFHQEKLRLHQVRLHGWGVVCGLHVLQHPNADCRRRYVRIEPGSAVDCCGHDILVPEEEILDLLSYKKIAELTKENPARIHALGICVRYVECPTESVPVLYDDCGCDDNGCAPNRILESYAFEVILDPSLALLPGVTPDALAGVVFARSAETSLAPNTPRFGVAPLVGSTIYALDARQPQKLITYDLSTRHASTIDLGADAMAIAARGNFVFVATGSKAGGAIALIQVFKLGDTTSTAKIDVAGATGAKSVAIAVSNQGDPAAIAYVRETGDLLTYAEDTANGLKAGPTLLGSATNQLSSFVVKPDGTVGYAIDEAAGTVKAITLAGTFNEAQVAALPATAKPSSLVYLDVATKSLLAVASRTDKALYVIDAANIGAPAGLLATITLDQPPEFIAAGADGMVYLLEESGSSTFVQAVDLAPLATGQAAVVSAARMIDASGLRLIGLLKDATAGLIASAQQIEIACADLVWNQTCDACDAPNCVALASIERYQAGAAVLDAGSDSLADDLANKRARIDNRAGRKILASTQTLQAWLECLQTKGTQGPPGPKGDKGDPGLPGTNGAPGKDGIGLYPDLPKILDIGWRFEDKIDFNKFLTTYVVAPGNNPAEREQNVALLKQKIIESVKTGQPIQSPFGILGLVPPLTLYFNKEMKGITFNKQKTGITRRAIEVTIDAPFAIQEGKPPQPSSAGVYYPFNLKLYGDIVEIPGPIPKTPNTKEPAAFAVSFVPYQQFFGVFDANGNPTPAWPLQLLVTLMNSTERAQLDPPRVTVSLKGNFVFAPDANGQYTELGVLDGDNIGGQVGEPSPAARLPPIQGGKNPSGNLTQGGLFESWFFLTLRGPEGGFAPATFPTFAPSLLGLGRMPPTINFSTAAEIAGAAGVSDAVARRIVQARAQQPFAGIDDLRTRAGLTALDVERIGRTVLMV